VCFTRPCSSFNGENAGAVAGDFGASKMADLAGRAVGVRWPAGAAGPPPPCCRRMADAMGWHVAAGRESAAWGCLRSNLVSSFVESARNGAGTFSVFGRQQAWNGTGVDPSQTFLWCGHQSQLSGCHCHYRRATGAGDWPGAVDGFQGFTNPVVTSLLLLVRIEFKKNMCFGSLQALQPCTRSMETFF
jgi:hypothetical protein